MSALADLRTRIGDALTAATEAPVLDAPVDAIEPPCFVLVWSDPWLVPATVCVWTARLDVLAIVGRIDPAPGYEQIEEMVATTIAAVESIRLPVLSVGPPSPFPVAGLTYLATRITTQSPLTLEA